MKTEEFKDTLLQVLELQLEYQLRAIRQLRGKAETEFVLAPRRGSRRESLVDLSVQILSEERKSLHVDDLVQLLQKRFGRLTDRDALSSALAKKARRGLCCVRARLPLLLFLIPGRIVMTKPDLGLIAKWLDPAIVEALDKRRRLRKEWRRYRKPGTLETLWLMLAVSLDTGRSSLHEILRLATGELNIRWSVSVAGFCKARARFSPGRALLVAR